MAGLTKDELKSALVTHGVEMNLSAAKKDELVALYEEFVAPHEENAGEFSSDDESMPLARKLKKASKSSKTASENGGKQLTEENSFIVGDIKVDELSDEELIKLLKENDIDVGPIVDSTRSLYQKKLAIVMREKTDQIDGNGEAQENGHSHVNGKPIDKSVAEFSADEDAVEEEEANAEDDDQPSVVVRPSSRMSTTPSKSIKKDSKKSPLQALGNSIRQRFGGSSSEKNERFTPTPRRSIHSYKITETTRETMTKNKEGVVTRDFTYNKETSESKGETGGSLVFVRKVLPGILLVLIMAALAYYVSTKRA